MIPSFSIYSTSPKGVETVFACFLKYSDLSIPVPPIIAFMKIFYHMESYIKYTHSSLKGKNYYCPVSRIGGRVFETTKQ